MAGRPRKPTHLHVISGSAKTNPARLESRADEPELEGADLRDAPAPSHLDGHLASIWKEVAGMLHARVAGQQDRLAFEMLVRIVADCRSDDATPAHYARMQAMMGEFGMTPASRSKVAQAKKADGPKGFGALRGAG